MKTKTFFAALLAMFGLCAQAQITYTISQTCEENGKLYDLRPNQGNPTTPGGGSENGHEYVDLGLSVKWATCNVGASKPEEYGNYYAWGETATKTLCDWSSYKWGDGITNITKYTFSDGNYAGVWYDNTIKDQDGYDVHKFVGDNKKILDLEDDAANANWGGEWRMPTKAEWEELKDSCTWAWITRNSVYGYKVSDKNGNNIFIPAAGYKTSYILSQVGVYGMYWFSNLSNSVVYPQHFFCSETSKVFPSYYDRTCALSVRPVIKK